MAYRLTNTEKWSDAWFLKLKPKEKLFFIYLYENCDIAGFIELNPQKWSFETGLTINEIDCALKKIQKSIVFSNNRDCLYIKNFLKHQKKLPLNQDNHAHRGILKRFELYSVKFGDDLINTQSSISSIKTNPKMAAERLSNSLNNDNNGNNYNYNDNNLNKEKSTIMIREKKENYKELLAKVISENKITLPNGFKELILEWLKYKSERGQAYKETGLKTFINSLLHKTGSDLSIAREIINKSMSNNWSGIFINSSNGNNRANTEVHPKRVNSFWDNQG